MSYSAVKNVTESCKPIRFRSKIRIRHNMTVALSFRTKGLTVYLSPAKGSKIRRAGLIYKQTRKTKCLFTLQASTNASFGLEERTAFLHASVEFVPDRSEQVMATLSHLSLAPFESSTGTSQTEISVVKKKWGIKRPLVLLPPTSTGNNSGTALTSTK